MAWASVREPLLHRVSWGGLFAGFFFGFGVWMVLLALGAGIGLSAFNAADFRNLGGYSLGLGIWGVIAGIIAMFCAGWFAARLGAVDERLAGMLHGAAVWGLTLAVGLWAAAMAVGGAAATAATAAQAGGATELQQRAQQMMQQAQPGAEQPGAAQAGVPPGATPGGRTAEKAATAGAASAWAFFIYGILTFVAAVLGGGAGAPSRRVIVREQPVPAPGAPLSPQRA